MSSTINDNIENTLEFYRDSCPQASPDQISLGNEKKVLEVLKDVFLARDCLVDRCRQVLYDYKSGKQLSPEEVDVMKRRVDLPFDKEEVKEELETYSKRLEHQRSIAALLDPPSRQHLQHHLDNDNKETNRRALIGVLRITAPEDLSKLENVGVVDKASRVLHPILAFIAGITKYDPSLTTYPMQATADAGLAILSGQENPFDSCKKQRYLGRGGYGAVELMMASDGKQYAVKTYTNPDELDTEFVQLLTINHELTPRVIRPVYVDPFKDQLFLEYEPGGTFEAAIQEDSLSPSRQLQVLQGIAQTLTDFHESDHRIYGDLKPANIVLDSEGTAKLIDLGLSFFDNESSPVARNHKMPYYLPPELLRSSPYFLQNNKIDSWSFGMLIWECLKKHDQRSPFGTSIRGVVWNFPEDFYSSKPNWPNVYRPTNFLDEEKVHDLDPTGALTTLMVSCLNIDPDERPSMGEILNVLKRLQPREHSSGMSASSSDLVSSSSSDSLFRIKK